MIQRPGQKILTIGNPGLSVTGPRGGAAAGPIVFDTFTDTDGTAITAHTPDIYPSTTWENLANSGQILSNRAYHDGDGSCVIESGLADCTITADLLSSYEASGISTRQVGIIFRYDGTDYWKAEANANSNLFRLLDPSGSAVVSVEVSIGAGELLTVKVVLSGDSIKAYLNGANEISTTSSANQSATKHGYWLFRRASAPYTYCDDFTVENLA